MDERRQRYLDAMGIQRWVPKAATPANAATVASPGAGAEMPTSNSQAKPSFRHELALDNPVQRPADEYESAPGGFVPESIGQEHAKALPPQEIEACTADAHTGLSPTWEALQAQVSACTACPLHQTRTQTVFGVGNRRAGWLVIGEAPGEQEDLQGEPFVGRAGQLLNEMLRATGQDREDVYIANILKCRPPGNRDPRPEEAAACASYLQRQVELIHPRIILAVGRIAAQNLLKTDTPVGKLRGRIHRYGAIPLVVVYHPAYLLRSLTEKRKAWDDLRLALRAYREAATVEY